MKVQRAHVVFEGRVQGVFFRANTQRIAREMGLGGWVRNMPDGSVEAVVEGTREQVAVLVERLKEEVKAAKVRRVRTVWSEAEKEFSGFEVRGDF